MGDKVSAVSEAQRQSQKQVDDLIDVFPLQQHAGESERYCSCRQRDSLKVGLGRGGLAAWGVALRLPLNSFASKAFESFQ